MANIPIVVGGSVRASANTNYGTAFKMLQQSYHAQKGCSGAATLLLKGKGTPRSQDGACISGILEHQSG